jgi:hypothetical protein
LQAAFRPRRAHGLQSELPSRRGRLEGASMSDPNDAPQRSDEIPLGQRLFDRPYLLLVACAVVMFVFYTGWGLLELASLGDAPLP